MDSFGKSRTGLGVCNTSRTGLDFNNDQSRTARVRGNYTIRVCGSIAQILLIVSFCSRT